MIQIDDATLAMLERLTALNELIAEDEDQPEEVYAECQRLIDTLREEFLPLVGKLCEAGLILGELKIPHDRWKDLKAVHFEAMTSYDNGAIWLECDDCGGVLINPEDN